jgi:glycosyltransferase involved in cell wall biosynthesis
VSGLDRVAVVIPARNEQELIGRCLRSVARSIHFARRLHGELLPDILVIVVADDCTDETIRVASAHAGVQVEVVSASNVGVARRHGSQVALSDVTVEPGRLWIANTDADSTVPANWIAQHLACAESGAQLMVGTVRPRMTDLTMRQQAAWIDTHPQGKALGHVHGANLGIRADTYLDAGGFLPQAEHEDNDLVDRAMSLGVISVATDVCEVVTSGRQIGRTAGGYAGYLRDELVAGAASLP